MAESDHIAGQISAIRIALGYFLRNLTPSHRAKVVQDLKSEFYKSRSSVSLGLSDPEDFLLGFDSTVDSLLRER